jgi:hypothetical protein
VSTFLKISFILKTKNEDEQLEKRKGIYISK